MVDVFLALSAAVVKSALKIWLGDNKFAADTSASIVDVLKAKISGDLEQRQARRFFEDLEVPVANRLRILRESEFRSLPENEWAAAVLAAGSSFDNARLTPRDLFARDLNPLFIEREIRADRQMATRDLSADGTALYDRLISEGCAHIIEIADKLPHFQVGAFAELLRRDRQILKLISNVLDRMPDKIEGESREASFTTAYIRHLATKLDRLELFGLEFESPWLPLSVAYVSLRTDAKDETDARSVEDRLATSQRIMIIGRAGSGKTTVLQWMAVRAARADFTGALADLNGCMPFYIRLREYVGKELPLPEQFIMGVASMLAPEMPQGWPRTQLRSGRALVLVDGVDELPVTEREKVVTWLHDLTEIFPEPRYIVTARPVSVSEDWLKQLGFAHCSLEAMPPSLITAFIRHWHDAARDRLADNEERNQLAQYENSLIKAVNSDRYLRGLADTPLLAGLLCALNRHLHSQLPRRRGEIYGKALSMFDQRDRARGIVTGEIVLDLTAKTHVLGDLALWMARNGESEVARETATNEVGRSLSSLPDVPNQPAEIFRILLERSGLLREPVARHVDFVHRTFQEYLAATAAVDGNAIGELLRNANDDQWREVVIMAAGQTNKHQTAQLIQGLLRRTVHSSSKIHRRHLLALACMQEIRSLEHELVLTVESMIPSLLPPRSMEQAEQLSSIGELLIPLLLQRLSADIKYSAFTIRAASLIGGPAALDLIEAIVSQTSETAIGDKSKERDRGIQEAIRMEAVRAWQYFESPEYADRILARIKVKDLDVQELPKVIDGLTKLRSIIALTIWPFEEDVDFAKLAELPKLRTLFIIYNNSQNLHNLAACGNISDLYLARYPRSGSPNEEISASDLPPALDSLSIQDARETINFADIGRLSTLTRVSLRGCRAIKNIDCLSALPNLKKVILEKCGRIDTTTLSSNPDLNIIYKP